MKKVFFLLALTASTFTFAGNTEPTTAAPGGNDGINKAIHAIKAECPNADGKLSYAVEVQSICFVSGSIRKVSFWKTPNCPPGMMCPQVIEEVGYVILDCDNNVVEVQCAVSEI